MNQSLLRLFFRDITFGLSYGKYKYLAFFGLVTVVSFALSIQWKTVGTNSIGTFFLLLRDNGYLHQISDYKPPYYWDFIQFFVLFLIGDFLARDQEDNQVYLLVRCRSKINYILSKICWVVFQNLLVFFILFSLVYVVSSLALGDFSIGGSTFFHKFIFPQMSIKVTPEQLLLRTFLGFVMTSIILSSIQLLCMQFMTPIVTFLGVIILSSISTFSGNKWLPAIHSMILKSDIFNHEHHLTLGFSITYCIILYALVTALILYVFRKIDIL